MNGTFCKMLPIEAEKAGTYDPRANSSRTIYYNTKKENGELAKKAGIDIFRASLIMTFGLFQAISNFFKPSSEIVNIV